MALDRFDIQGKDSLNLFTDALVVVDRETGVNYLFVHRGYGGGLTPLLDSDGKPIITKDKDNYKRKYPAGWIREQHSGRCAGSSRNCLRMNA